MTNQTILYFEKNLENFSEVQEIFQNIKNVHLLSSSNIKNFKDIVKDTKPKIILLNIALKNSIDDLKILSWVNTTQFNIRCIMLGPHPDYISAAIEQGAQGFVPVDNLKLLPTAVDQVSQGKPFFPNLKKGDLTLQKQILNKSHLIRDTWHTLSEKEKHIVALKKLGWDYGQIANMFKISPKSVEFLASSVLQKTQQNSIDEVLEVYEDLVEELTED